MIPFNLGPGEMVVVMMIAVLLFGKRLPEVGRSLGKGIVEFKRGLQGIEDDATTPAGKSSSPSVPARRDEARLDPGVDYAVPKFEPPAPATPAPTPGVEDTVARMG